MEKLKEETEGIKRMRKQLEDMLAETITMAKTGQDISHEVPGAMTDMIKDLTEAEKNIAECCKASVEIEYKKKIIEAMEAAEDEKKLLEKVPVMGYSRMYYPEEYNPIDRYPIMGYTRDTMGTTVNQGNYGTGGTSGTGRMGYEDPMMHVSERGRNYDTYRDMKRHYSGSQDQESKRKMAESRDKVFEEMESIIMELWPDLDAPEKGKYMQKGQKMLNRLQSMS